MQSSTTIFDTVLTINHVRIIAAGETPWEHDSHAEMTGPYTGTIDEILAELRRDAELVSSETWRLGDVLWVARASGRRITLKTSDFQLASSVGATRPWPSQESARYTKKQLRGLLDEVGQAEGYGAGTRIIRCALGLTNATERDQQRALDRVHEIWPVGGQD